MKFPGTIRVHVAHPQLPDSVSSCVMHRATPELTVKYLNALSVKRGVGATYRLATEEEYWAYREKLKAEIATAEAQLEPR